MCTVASTDYLRFLRRALPFFVAGLILYITLIEYTPYSIHNTSDPCSDGVGAPKECQTQRSPPRLYVADIGRLGNHLFQYAALYSIAKTTNRIPVLLKKMELVSHFKGITAEVSRNFTVHTNYTVFEKAAGKFDSSVFQMPSQTEDVGICCYFQSWRYFQTHEQDLRNELSFVDKLQGRAVKQLLDFSKIYLQHRQGINFTKADITYIGVHIRRQDMTIGKLWQRGYVTAPKSYLKNAMNYYRNQYEHTLFVIATDDQLWCHENLAIEIHNNEAFISTLRTPEADLALLSSCNHTIMTVGTFGWWAGWLARGQVVYYKDWPRPNSEINKEYSKEDYFPPHWIPMS